MLREKAKLIRKANPIKADRLDAEAAEIERKLDDA